jgi:hypothetical protein
MTAVGGAGHHVIANILRLARARSRDAIATTVP